MLECSVICNPIFARNKCVVYIYMVTFTLFVYLFNPNTKYRDIHMVSCKSAKKQTQRY